MVSHQFEKIYILSKIICIRKNEIVKDYAEIQCLPEVSEHPREPYGNTSFSRRSHYLNFRRNATNFCLELAR